MASMTIRGLELDRDVDDLVRLVLDTFPTAVVNRQAILHRHATVPERAQPRTWVAEVDGEVVGRSDVFLNFFSKGSHNCFVGVAVRSDHRRQGLATQLFPLAEARAAELGAEGLIGNFYENPAGVAFARARGFRQVRAETESILDPRTVTERPPTNVDLRPVTEVDPRLVHRVDAEATLDVPQTETADDSPFDEWRGHVLEHPLFASEGSFVAMVDEVAAAVSLLVADPESGRGMNMFTGVLRAYRGRGLALAVKLATTHWAAANGITQIVTDNDETNAPMLAINRRLGYEPVGRRVEYLREREGLPGERGEHL
jgi:GNAT superfamily N-acetyltransferase